MISFNLKIEPGEMKTINTNEITQQGKDYQDEEINQPDKIDKDQVTFMNL